MVHILAVDDDNEVLETVGRVLRHEAYEVSLATSAAQALVLLEKRMPDLLILDIIMPEMDGITLCRQLRRDLALHPAADPVPDGERQHRRHRQRAGRRGGRLRRQAV